MKPSIAVEIGSARGRSACFIAMALKQNGFGQLYAVDPHTATDWNDYESVETYDVMSANLRKLDLEDVVSIVRNYSREALAMLPRPFDLVFIDGDHSYEGVKADWNNYTPHMSPFGVVVFHDTTWDLNPDSKWHREDMGVPRFLDELRASGYPVITIDRDCGISIVQPKCYGVPLRR
jgi:predicted O-methyltransferase YrrM